MGEIGEMPGARNQHQFLVRRVDAVEGIRCAGAIASSAPWTTKKAVPPPSATGPDDRFLIGALCCLCRVGDGMGAHRTAWDGRFITASALFSVLAFNLVFFAQELMLALPKAFVPGVHVWLYHNNHHWTGDAPILPLLQGTGGLTDLLMGLLFALPLNGAAARSMTARLFLFWMAFQGLYQGLSQLIFGAIVPDNDMGVAFGYLGFSPGIKDAIFATGLILSAMAGFWLARAGLRLFGTTAETLTIGSRMGFFFRTVMLPALVAGPLLIPFRMPRDSIEMWIFPTVLMLFGALWVVIGGGFSPTAARPARPSPSLVVPLASLIVVLVIFQFLLRPGIAFS